MRRALAGVCGGLGLVLAAALGITGIAAIAAAPAEAAKRCERLSAGPVRHGERAAAARAVRGQLKKRLAQTLARHRQEAPKAGKPRTVCREIPDDLANAYACTATAEVCWEAASANAGAPTAPAAPPASPAPAPPAAAPPSPPREAPAAETSGKGWLGAEIADLKPAEAAALGLPAGKGVRVVKPVPGGPAETDGLRAGDVILSLDGEEVRGVSGFVAAVSARKPGAKVALEEIREGAARTVAVTLGARPAAPPAPAAGNDPLADDFRGLYERAIQGQDPEEIIAAAEQALALEPKLGSWPLQVSREWVRGALWGTLGNAYANRPGLDRAGNLEKAIAAYAAARTVLTHEAFPYEWATVQNNLGVAYRDRIRGGRAGNQEKAIAAFEAALTVRTRADLPQDWATTQNNLGVAYADRIQGARAENLKKTIGAYEAALTVLTREGLPQDWALTQNNLGLAYWGRIRGEKADNLERAIAAYEAALAVRTREALPLAWAMTQNNLGNAYQERILGERSENLEKAIAIYEAALTVRTREALPLDWALTQNNLGTAYGKRILGERADNLERAIAAFEAALTVMTRDALPQVSAGTQNNLGNAYHSRIWGARADNMEKAIAAYKAALTIATRKALPLDWALTQNNLGTAYRERILGERADNLEQAIAAFEAALTVRTRAALPQDWATTQNNLGTAYYDRIRGGRAGNQEKAIAAFEAALTVRTRADLPQDWATTQNNLGVAYADRIQGARAENLKKTIGAYEAALTVYTRVALPRDHLRTARLLGHALLEKRDWQKARDAFASARDAFLTLFGQGLNDAEAQDLIEQAGTLFSEAAFAAAQMSEAEHAFTFAAEGKARLLSVALKLQNLDLPEDQRQKLETLRIQIRAQEKLAEAAKGAERGPALERLGALRRDLLALVQEAEGKKAPGGALALAASALPPGSALAAPIVTDFGGKLLIVTAAPDGPRLRVLDLPELTTGRVEEFLRGPARDGKGGWLGAYNINYLPKEQADARWGEWLAEIAGTGTKLWDLFAGRLHAALKEQGVAEGAPLLWLPSGALGVLPLALAEEPATHRRLGELYTLSTAPSLDALVTAKANLAATLPAGPPPALAAAVNPTGDLPFTEIEGALAASHFKGAAVFGKTTATPDVVLAGLRGASYWHFASHGFFDWGNARNSGLLMKDKQPLTVGRLLDAGDLGHPRLVALSACETGLYDTRRNPEEFTGLPAAFMALGASGVLSTLWLVDDRATALLVARFYDFHLDEGQPPAAALKRAQAWLRDTPRGDLLAYIQAARDKGRLDAAHFTKLDNALRRGVPANARFLGIWQALHEAAAAAGKALKEATKGPGRDPSEHPFAHPYFWGGFTYTGL